MTQTAVTASYEGVRDEIVRILLEGHERARLAVEREQVRTYWEVGRLLFVHLQQLKSNKGRADYGEQVVKRLGEELEIGERRLYKMLEFGRAYDIMPTRANLTFSHYVNLSRLEALEEREVYERVADEEGWSVRQLEGAIRVASLPALPEEEKPAVKLAKPLVARRGGLFTYRLRASEEGCWKLDLGFRIRLRVEVGDLEGAAPGVSVESIRDNKGGVHGDSSGARYRFAVDDKPRTKLFTYTARVLRVIDGDTLWAEIDCGFGVMIEEKLRLRGIDTPELNTVEGARARLFVVEALKGVEVIGVSTSTTDLYDRYVADVLYLPGEADPRRVVREGRFLNRELIDGGLAEAFGD